MSVGFVGCCGVWGGGLVSRGKAVNEQHNTILWYFFGSIYVAGTFSQKPKDKISISFSVCSRRMTSDHVECPRAAPLRINWHSYVSLNQSLRVCSYVKVVSPWAVSYCISVFQLPSREPTANHCPSSRWELSARLLYIIHALSFFSFQRFPPVKRIKTPGRTIFNENFQRLKEVLIDF